MLEKYPVLPGAEPFFFNGNHIGILISHGFVGTPQSVRFLGEYISSHGYTVYGARLKGHGTHYEDMERCNYWDWIQSLEDGYRFLQQHCRDIFIIGQSMGGTLTINLASKYPDIKGIVLVNAAMTAIPEMEEFKDKMEPRFIDEGAPDIKANDVHEITYAKAPIRSIKQLLSLMDITRGKLPSVTCPTFAFRSEEDHVVPPENTDYIMAHIQSDIKKIIPLYNSYHVASMDYEKKFIADQCCLFIEKYASNPREMEIS
ncbi:alpha/beta hydrolase [Neobacillus ginsengisoli]|uniref:Carboxylesterase n=1 Tax=Neobacillus ginsengisoli TaxID=904295 RepID=A0ABT9Y1R7_9BACI|nr:alpha/beta fold hydrolase [Neobacillus ginsengisoli]MDQ0201526.1 carboxylesterase [Neobacillus ginsengisoli]